MAVREKLCEIIGAENGEKSICVSEKKRQNDVAWRDYFL